MKNIFLILLINITVLNAECLKTNGSDTCFEEITVGNKYKQGLAVGYEDIKNYVATTISGKEIIVETKPIVYYIKQEAKQNIKDNLLLISFSTSVLSYPVVVLSYFEKNRYSSDYENIKNRYLSLVDTKKYNMEIRDIVVNGSYIYVLYKKINNYVSSFNLKKYEILKDGEVTRVFNTFYGNSSVFVSELKRYENNFSLIYSDEEVLIQQTHVVFNRNSDNSAALTDIENDIYDFQENISIIRYLYSLENDGSLIKKSFCGANTIDDILMYLNKTIKYCYITYSVESIGSYIKETKNCYLHPLQRNEYITLEEGTFFTTRLSDLNKNYIYTVTDEGGTRTVISKYYFLEKNNPKTIFDKLEYKYIFKEDLPICWVEV